MNAQQAELYARIHAFDIDSGEAAFPFAARLARENGWPAAYAARAIEEYRRFAFLVGSNFNNDGTALYEAMAALFIAQMTGTELSLGEQAMVVVTSVIASVGAAGIPEAGLVTMTLVFSAVHLPAGYIALLLPIDWFLDRCRTAINVMGDMNVSCMLDGKTREAQSTEAPNPLLSEIA